MLASLLQSVHAQEAMLIQTEVFPLAGHGTVPDDSLLTLFDNSVNASYWRSMPMEVKSDILVSHDGDVVMARDEAPYMHELAKVVARDKGSVLEIGFGA